MLYHIKGAAFGPLITGALSSHKVCMYIATYDVCTYVATLLYTKAASIMLIILPIILSRKFTYYS